VLFRVAVEAVVDLQERAVVAVEEPARETVKDKRKRNKGGGREKVFRKRNRKVRSSCWSCLKGREVKLKE
jgi:hypothetical protein